MDVAVLVQSLLDLDVGSADVDEVRSALCDVGRVQAWLDGVKINLSRRLLELQRVVPSMSPDHEFAAGTRSSQRDAEKVAERAKVLGRAPRWRRSSTVARCRVSMWTMFARGVKQLDPAERARLFDEHGDRLAEIARRVSLDRSRGGPAAGGRAKHVERPGFSPQIPHSGWSGSGAGGYGARWVSFGCRSKPRDRSPQAPVASRHTEGERWQLGATTDSPSRQGSMHGTGRHRPSGWTWPLPIVHTANRYTPWRGRCAGRTQPRTLRKRFSCVWRVAHRCTTRPEGRCEPCC